MEQVQVLLQRVIDYIEESLTDDELDNETLARIAGYSEFHFLRLFTKIVGITPADYIRKRRITEIAKRISTDNGSISEIAFAYGFNSKENFTRAFKKEHHILPTAFRTAGCSLRLFEPFSFDSDFIPPQVSFTYYDPFSLIAYPCDEAFPPHFWNRYNAECRSLKLSGGKRVEVYGAMRWNAECGALDYFIGIRDEEANGDRFGTVQLQIPGGLYAAFDTHPVTSHDFVSVIRKTWNWIGSRWLPGNGYRRSGGYEMEIYLETSKKFTERILIPLEME